MPTSEIADFDALTDVIEFFIIFVSPFERRLIANNRNDFVRIADAPAYLQTRSYEAPTDIDAVSNEDSHVEGLPDLVTDVVDEDTQYPSGAE